MAVAPAMLSRALSHRAARAAIVIVNGVGTRGRARVVAWEPHALRCCWRQQSSSVGSTAAVNASAEQRSALPHARRKVAHAAAHPTHASVPPRPPGMPPSPSGTPARTDYVPPPPAGAPPPPPPPPPSRASAKPPSGVCGKSGSAASPSGLAFEEHWTLDAVQAGLASGILVQGKVHVPSFHTDKAYIIATVPFSRGAGASVNDGDEEEYSEVWIPVTGFMARNRAMHGDVVAALPLWTPWRPPSAASPSMPSSSSASAQVQRSDRSDGVGHAAEQAVAEESQADIIGSAPMVQQAASEEHSVEARKKELYDVIVGLFSADASLERETLALSVLGGHPDVRRLRKGLGPLRRVLEGAPHLFSVTLAEDGKVLVSLHEGVDRAEQGKLARGTEVISAGKASPEAELTPQQAQDQRDRLCNIVLERLRESDEKALPLSVLGALPEVQRLKKGLRSSLSRALRQFPDHFEVVEIGTPPEAVVALLSSGDTKPTQPLPPSNPPPTSAPLSRPNQAAAPQTGPAPVAEVPRSWEQARCRVVAILERRATRDEIVAVLRAPSQRGEDLCQVGESSGQSVTDGPLRLQPRDRRLPAFWSVPSLRENDVLASMLQDGHIAQQVADRRKKKKTNDRRKEAQLAAQRARSNSVSQEALHEALRAPGAGGSLLCVMRYVDWPRESLSPRAHVSEILGVQGTMAAESDALLAFYGLEWRPFADQVEQSLRSAFPSGQEAVNAELQAGRMDLRHLRCITIDPPTAKDLDDAVSFTRGPVAGTYRIGVHVADVTHFVKAGSVADLEARQRATTVYLVGKVYPMLPRWLSENLCSLLPDGDRLAFSVFFTIDSEGELVTSDAPTFCRSVIRTQARLDYNTVDRLLDSDQEERARVRDGGCPEDVLQDLRTLADLTSARRKLRIGGGAVALERSQLVFDVDDDGRVTGLVQEAGGTTSHHLIEELMVLANHVVATKLGQAGRETSKEVREEAALPNALLRRHPDTEGEVRKKVFEMLTHELRVLAPSEATLAELLAWCQKQQSRPAYEALCAEVLTAFKEAEYIVADVDTADTGAESVIEADSATESTAASENDSTDVAHWALSLPAYMHFTSPIRRYADILVHRRLAYILDQEGEKRERPHAETQTTHEKHADFLKELQEAVAHCNVKKRDAQDAQSDSIQLALSEHVHHSGGMDAEDAIITRIILPSAHASDTSSSGEEEDAPGARGTRQRPAQGGRDTSGPRKAALEIYVPLAQCTRSVSLQALNLELAYDGREQGGENAETVNGALEAVPVRVRGTTEQVQLRTFEPMKVRLVSSQDVESNALKNSATDKKGSTARAEPATPRHWTIRFPWATSPAMSSDAASGERSLGAEPHPQRPRSDVSGCGSPSMLSLVRPPPPPPPS